MESFEDIRNRLIDDGFVEEPENTFTYEHKSYTTVSVNGNVTKKENKDSISLIYNGTGGTMDSDDECMDDMMFFDIVHNGEFIISVGVDCYDDIIKILNGK